MLQTRAAEIAAAYVQMTGEAALLNAAFEKTHPVFRNALLEMAIFYAERYPDPEYVLPDGCED